MLYTHFPIVEGDLGGNIGLLVGASAITAVEILDLIIYNTAVKLFKMKKRRRPLRIASTENLTEDKHDNVNVQNNNLVLSNGTGDIQGELVSLDPTVTKVDNTIDRGDHLCKDEDDIISTYL